MELIIEGLDGDSKDLGGLGLIAVLVGQHLQNVIPLKIFEAHGDRAEQERVEGEQQAKRNSEIQMD